MRPTRSGCRGWPRLYDLFVTYEAMTPGEYKRQGADLEIRYGLCPTPFGKALVLTTDRGIAASPSSTAMPGRRSSGRARNGRRALSSPMPRRANARLRPCSTATPTARRALLKGTNFQIKVWSALLRLPPGQLISYGELAREIGRPKAAQAIGRALGQPSGFIVPCHRVIRATGALGDYRWGKARRRAILAWEAADRDAA